MAVYVPIPKLGMTMKKAKLVEWKAEEGDWVEKGAIVLVIETEKVNWEIEAEASGFLHILVEEDNEALVSQVVGIICETKEELEAQQKESPKEIFNTVPEITECQKSEAPPSEATAPATVKTKQEEHIRISPVARKMAEENMIDIATVTGTGPGGRIVKEDIESEIRNRGKAVTPAVRAGTDIYDGKKVKNIIPLKGIRKTIAERLHHSLSLSAQLTVMGEFDMTEVVRLRKSLLAQEEVIGTRISYTDILVFVLSRALKDNPIINSSLIDDEIKMWEDINIGVAFSLGEEGLIVPVIENADQKSLVEISKSLKAVGDKVKEGKLMPDDVSGGTFTMTTMASTGVSYFQTPIINQPESAIIATAPIVDKPVVRDGEIKIAPIMSYSFTIDHRVINGAPEEKFLLKVQELLGNPSLLLVL